MKINKWKCFGLTILSWFILSVLAKILYEIMSQHNANYMLVDALSIVWSYACLIACVFLAIKLKSWKEILYGIITFIVCLLPFISPIVGMIYFFRLFYTLEKVKATNKKA
jgi:hypothetical protein